MKPDYSDITSRLGEPLWWDENGVPRYEPFHPDWCDVYANYVAFMEVECQNCGRVFRVAVTDCRLKWNHVLSKQPIELPSPDSLGSFYYVDPPRHSEVGVCLTGDTMTTIPKRVLEFWHRDFTEDQAEWDWHRHPEYEIEIQDEFEEAGK